MVVVFFIVKSENKRSPRTDFAVDDTKENFRTMFVFIAENYRIAGKRSNVQNFENETDIRPILNSHTEP